MIAQHNNLIDMVELKCFRAGHETIAGANCRKAALEESPGSTGQGCRVTPGEGNFKESATEKKTADFR